MDQVVTKKPPKANVLLVDDVLENIKSLKYLLEDMDINTISAMSGKEALKMLLNHDFALILLDVEMPEMNGVETASIIRSRKKSNDIPIIFITAHDQSDIDIPLAYSVGAVDFITKPLVPEIIKSKVKVFVDLFNKNEELKIQKEKELEIQNSLHEKNQKEKLLQIEKERLESEIASIKRLTGLTYDKNELSNSSLTEEFRNNYSLLVKEYQELFRLVVEERIHDVKDQILKVRTEIINRFGLYRLGPREVVEIHTEAVEKLLKDSTNEKSKLYLEEGRILLLEIMGNLLAYYRNFVIKE